MRRSPGSTGAVRYFYPGDAAAADDWDRFAVGVGHGYVADRKLGTIVGSTTAGANGNMAVFGVPGGFRITFTGMRVTGHDGSARHHLVGAKPDVPAPTIAGLRAGRDEVLEKALALVQ